MGCQPLFDFALIDKWLSFLHGSRPSIQIHGNILYGSATTIGGFNMPTGNYNATGASSGHVGIFRVPLSAFTTGAVSSSTLASITGRGIGRQSSESCMTSCIDYDPNTDRLIVVGNEVNAVAYEGPWNLENGVTLPGLMADSSVGGFLFLLDPATFEVKDGFGLRTTHPPGNVTDN